MKILIINNSFWNFYNFRINLLSEIKKNIDCDIHLAAPEDEYYNKLNNEFSTYKLEFNSSNTNPFNELFLITKFHSLINKVKPNKGGLISLIILSLGKIFLSCNP